MGTRQPVQTGPLGGTPRQPGYAFLPQTGQQSTPLPATSRRYPFWVDAETLARWWYRVRVWTITVRYTYPDGLTGTAAGTTQDDIAENESEIYGITEAGLGVPPLSKLFSTGGDLAGASFRGFLSAGHTFPTAYYVDPVAVLWSPLMDIQSGAGASSFSNDPDDPFFVNAAPYVKTTHAGVFDGRALQFTAETNTDLHDPPTLYEVTFAPTVYWEYRRPDGSGAGWSPVGIKQRDQREP